jgi:hypothetical protein
MTFGFWLSLSPVIPAPAFARTGYGENPASFTTGAIVKFTSQTAWAPMDRMATPEEFADAAARSRIPGCEHTPPVHSRGVPRSGGGDDFGSIP